MLLHPVILAKWNFRRNVYDPEMQREDTFYLILLRNVNDLWVKWARWRVKGRKLRGYYHLLNSLPVRARCALVISC